MVNESGIEWLAGPNGEKGLTVNPVVGCERISPGCGGGYIKGPNGESGGCWAEHLVSTRMSKNPKLPLYKDLARDGGGWSGVVRIMPDRLADIVALGRRKKGARVFVCDLSDLFHKDVPFEYIAAVWGAMACAPNHLFYVLTKRPARALEFANWLRVNGGPARVLADALARYHFDDELTCAVSNYVSGWSRWKSLPDDGNPLNGSVERWPLPNVVFGVTVEDRRYGVPRLDLARQFPARWRFASVEPQLEDLGDVDWRGFELLVQGGEAGDGARPFDLAWARKVRDQARRDGVRWFMKQAGDYVVEDMVSAFGPGSEIASWGALKDAGSCRLMSLGKKGNDLARLPEDLRIRENIPMPGAAQ